MAVITIDGKKLEVPDNKNVLECALDAGIYIPHLCHHKDLNPLGSCRMCIVEVNGQDGVMASCTLEAKDGMVITTKSQKLNQHLQFTVSIFRTCRAVFRMSCQ